MKKCLLIYFVLVTQIICRAQAPVIEYQLVVGGLSEPVDVVNAGDGSNRLFIVQRGGLIRIWDGNAMLPASFLNVSSLLSLSGSERGLLSMVFHPNYASNRYFFIYYTNTSGALTLARYRTSQANPNIADAASGMVLLSIPHSGNANHNGGKLIFGKDGYLYFGTGDGGGSNDPSNNAQTGTSLLGKMLRIDVNDFTDITPPLYSIPSSNPYTSTAGVNDEIIALGLRNPWRWSFDRLTNDMWIGDVGQNAREEINFRPADSILEKTNYGWRCLEGKITNPSASAACPPPPDNVFPVLDYNHSASGGFSVTGGYVYRGTEYPALVGYYVCTDYGTGNIWLIKPNPGGGWEITAQTSNRLTNVSSFGEAENATLYAVKLTSGTAANSGGLYKVITSAALPARIISFTGSVRGHSHILTWKTVLAEPGSVFVLERSIGDNGHFEEVDRKMINTAAQQNFQSVLPAVSKDAFYRIKTINAGGNMSYSPMVLLSRRSWQQELFSAYRSGDLITVVLNDAARSVHLYNAGGALIYQQSMNDQTGYIKIPVMNQKGIVFIQVISANGMQIKKVLL